MSANLAENIVEMIKEHEVKFIDLRFTDSKGKEQHVSIPAMRIGVEELEEGKMFDGSSIDGWKHINESDMLLMPDLATAFIDPFFVVKINYFPSSFYSSLDIKG